MRQQRGVVIGRDGDVREVADALCTTGEAARVLLVIAGAGMGKTTVLEQARRTAAQDGATVVRLGWQDEETEDTADAMAIAAGCGLFVADPDGFGLPLSTVHMARLRTAARVGGASGLSAFSETLAAAARQTPFALVVDGIERMPRRSADAWELLLRVFRPRGVPVVMTARPQPAADSPRDELTAAADRVLELPPLRPAEAATLINVHVTRRFGRPAEPALADAVSRALGTLAGNPRAVLSVLDALDEQDLLELDGRLCLTLEERHLRLTTQQADLLGLARPHRLADPETVEAAIVAARVLDRAEVRIDDVFRLTPSADARSIERALDRLLAHRILTADQQGRLSLPSLAELRLVAAAVGSRAELRRARQSMPPDAIDQRALDRLSDAAAYGDLAGALGAVLGDRYVTAGDSIAARYRGMVHDYLAGDWDAALAAARRIEVRSRTHTAAGIPHLARALAAEIHSTRGDVARAQAWLDLVPGALAHPLAARARLAVRYWSGRAEETIEGAWHDARQARKSGLLTGVERVLLRILSFAADEDRPHVVQQALEELETLHEEAATPMTYEALLIGRGIAHRDADSALTAHKLIKRRGDVHLGLICSLCLTHTAGDPRSWLTEAIQNARSLGLGRPFRTAVTRAAQQRSIPIPRLRQTNEELTEIDIALARMVSNGATNGQSATELACSHKTVEKHLTRLFQRTGCRSRGELAATWLNGTLTRPGIASDSDPSSADTPDGH